MMKQMRENTKVILWIVVIAFVITIFAVWGLDLQTGGPTTQQNLLGRVNGVAITPQAYQSVYNQLAAQFRASAPDGRLSAAQQEALQDRAWESIVDNILTEEEIGRLGITVSDEEVLGFLRTAPPPEIQGYFLDEAGNFDFSAYQAALNDPNADWTAVEALARQRIPLFKLNQYLASEVHVTFTETRKLWEEQNVRMVAEYAVFPIADVDISGYAPGEEEIAAYYDAHRSDFSVDEKAVITYARVPIDPTASDRDDVAFTIRTIHDEIVAGGDFDDLARTYSEGSTAALGGHTGFLSVDEFDPAVGAVVTGLSVDEVSDPIAAEDGMYLVKLLETKKEEDKTTYRVQEIFLRLSAGAQTIDSLITVAQEVARAASESADLAAAAAAAGVDVATTDPFSANQVIPGVGLVPSLSRFAFANPVGTLSNVINDDESYYIARVDQRIPEGVEPLEAVRDVIRERLIEEQRREGAKRAASAFRLSMSASPEGRNMKEVAQQYHLSTVVTDTFTVQDPVGDIPPASRFQRAAVVLEPGPVSPPIEANGVYYVFRLLYRSQFDEEAFAEQMTALRDRLYQEKVQRYIAYWYESLREKSKVEDFRGTL